MFFYHRESLLSNLLIITWPDADYDLNWSLKGTPTYLTCVHLLLQGIKASILLRAVACKEAFCRCHLVRTFSFEHERIDFLNVFSYEREKTREGIIIWTSFSSISQAGKKQVMDHLICFLSIWSFQLMVDMFCGGSVLYTKTMNWSLVLLNYWHLNVANNQK